MENKEYINIMLKRLSTYAGAPACLGYLYADGDIIQFLAHVVFTDAIPHRCSMRTYIVTVNPFVSPLCGYCALYNDKAGYSTTFKI